MVEAVVKKYKFCTGEQERTEHTLPLEEVLVLHRMQPDAAYLTYSIGTLSRPKVLFLVKTKRPAPFFPIYMPKCIELLPSAEYFSNCWSPGIIPHNHLYGLQTMIQKREISSCVNENVFSDVRGWRRTGRLVGDDRKPTVTQITAWYNWGMQNTISECTKHQSLKQMGSLWDMLEQEILFIDLQPRDLQQQVIISCQYVSNTFMNLHQEELRQFWKKKGGSTLYWQDGSDNVTRISACCEVECDRICSVICWGTKKKTVGSVLEPLKLIVQK